LPDRIYLTLAKDKVSSGILCGNFSDSMPVRLGQFYALVLLLTCLGINIAFFSEVREPFLGSEDPLASVKSSLSELDIQGKIAAFYPKTSSKVDDVQVPPPSAPPKAEPPVQKKQHQQPTPPPKAEPEKSIPQPAPKEAPQKPAESMPVVTPAENLQTSATVLVPQPAIAAVKPVVADQFKPVTPESKPNEPKPKELVKSVKLSSSPVWDTIDTVLERPIRYE
jgi:hypothetical protein